MNYICLIDFFNEKAQTIPAKGKRSIAEGPKSPVSGPKSPWYIGLMQKGAPNKVGYVFYCVSELYGSHCSSQIQRKDQTHSKIENTPYIERHLAWGLDRLGIINSEI